MKNKYVRCAPHHVERIASLAADTCLSTFALSLHQTQTPARMGALLRTSAVRALYC